MKYTIFDKNFPADEQDNTEFTLLGLAFECDWKSDDFTTIAKMATHRTQTFGSLVVTRVS